MPAAMSAALSQFGLVFAFALGAIVGSFLNVVAHRLPLDLSVVKPGSRCPACRTPVRAVDGTIVAQVRMSRGRARDLLEWLREEVGGEAV